MEFNKTQELNSARTLEELNDAEVFTLIPLLIYLSIVIVIGAIGNSLVCYIYLTHFKKSNSKYFILCLAFIDLFSCLISHPFEIKTILHQFNFTNGTTCRVSRFVNSVPTVASGFLFLVIAIDRYRKVCKPFEWQISSRVARYICAGTIFCGVMFSWPVLFLYGVRSVTVTDINANATECSVNDDFKETVYPFLYNSTKGFLFIVGSSSLVVLFTLIARQINRHTDEMAKYSQNIELKISNTLEFEQTEDESSYRDSSFTGTGKAYDTWVPDAASTHFQNDKSRRSKCLQIRIMSPDIICEEYDHCLQAQAISGESSAASIRCMDETITSDSPDGHNQSCRNGHKTPSEKSICEAMDINHVSYQEDVKSHESGQGNVKQHAGPCNCGQDNDQQHAGQSQDNNEHHDGQCNRSKDNNEHHDGQCNRSQDNNEHHDGQCNRDQDNNEHHDGQCNRSQDNNEHHDGQCNRSKDNNEHHDGQCNRSQDNNEHHNGQCNRSQDNIEHHDGQCNRDQDNNEHHDGQYNRDQVNNEHHDGQYNRDQVNHKQHAGPCNSGQDKVTNHASTPKKSSFFRKISHLGTFVSSGGSSYDVEEAHQIQSPNITVGRIRVRRARRISFLMFLISLAYVLSYMPHVLLMITRVLKDDFVSSMTSNQRAAYKFFLRSYALNSAVNPFIYSVCDKRFRRFCGVVWKRIW